MRCPHCAGEIHDASRFCGICGRRVADAAVSPAPAPAPVGAAPSGGGQVGASVSIFELPVSRGARIARVVAILALDAVLTVAGVAMIVSYLGNRDEARDESAPAQEGEQSEPEVQALPPAPLQPGGAAEEGRDEAPAKARETSTKVRGGGDGPSRGAGSDGRGGGSDRRPEADPDPQPAPDPKPDPEPGSAEGEPDSEGEGEGDDEAGGPPTDAEIQELARRIGALVDRHRAQLQRCYKTAAKVSTPDQPLEGQVDIQFAVTPEGRAEDVHAVANTTGSDQLAACLRGLVASWSFPQPPGSEPIPYVWPFKFRAPQ